MKHEDMKRGRAEGAGVVGGGEGKVAVMVGPSFKDADNVQRPTFNTQVQTTEIGAACAHERALALYLY